MINLRYHVVSLIAVFLALTVGIVMGSTVIDRVTVDALNRRVTAVSKSVRDVQSDNDKLRGQLSQVQDFANQARDQIARDRLKGVPVMVVAVTGIDRKAVDGLRQALTASDATLAGSLWFTAKMRLDNDADARALAGALGISVDRPDVERRQALGQVASVLEGTTGTTGTAGTAGSNPLPALVAAGFLVFEAPPAPTASVPASAPGVPGSLPSSGVRVVLVSGAGADVGDDQVAVPLAQDLAQSAGRLVAAESGQDTPGGRGVFMGLLLNDSAVWSRISTVDDLESSMGQAAAVLALDDLSVPRTGHYGVGAGVSRLLPPATP
ncbi:MAG: copper transporter [Acidimicrobiales bacterium]